MAANASLENSEGAKVNLENATVTELITELSAQQRIPGGTYRLQFHAGFTLRQAEALTSYFNELGITDCYASPLFKARTGSSHGYDICDHSQLNPEIGSETILKRYGCAPGLWHGAHPGCGA